MSEPLIFPADLPPNPTYEEVLAAFGLPQDSKAVVLTPTSIVAVAVDYPEPANRPPEEK